MEDRRKLDQMEHVVTVSYAEDEGRGSDHMALDDEQKPRPKLMRQKQLDVPSIKDQYRIRSLSDTVTIKRDKKACSRLEDEQSEINQVPISEQPMPKQSLRMTRNHRFLASEGSLTSGDGMLHSCLASSTDLARTRFRSVTFAEEGSDDFFYIDDSVGDRSSEGLNQDTRTPDDFNPGFTDALGGVFPEDFTMYHKMEHQACSIDDVPPTITQTDKGEVQVANPEKLARQDSQSIYSFVMEKDFRYYFQHPYIRLFVTYFVIFCNFLIFAEDPVSHSHTESAIIGLGNVFSFIGTNYPPDWRWSCLKAFMWSMAMLIGMLFGRWFRLKMFRDDQGTWMIMFLTVLVFLYIFSHIYNLLLQMFGHPKYCEYRITAKMGITNESFMKAAACGTWLGDLVTAWMVTDMMLQDNLYPNWANRARAFWKTHGKLRIVLFWTSNVTVTWLVIYLIVSDYITWDKLNRDFVATTEVSRAYLASFILVMDLLIVMQDWDFPHFVCDMDIKLPGLTTSVVSFELWNCADSKNCLLHITGKWFNYGIIFLVMILDLNMWKNQIFYSPIEYGQYTGPDNKIYTVNEQHILKTRNATFWSYQWRSTQIDRTTNMTYINHDMLMNSRYMDHDLIFKGMAFIPSLLGFVMLGTLVYLYGRFPPKCDKSLGGRLKKKKTHGLSNRQSSWNKERSKRFLPPAVLSCTNVIRSKDVSSPGGSTAGVPLATPELSRGGACLRPNSSDDLPNENPKIQSETFL